MTQVQQHGQDDPEYVEPLDAAGRRIEEHPQQRREGKEVSPSSGRMNVSNTAFTYVGRAIQMIKNKSRGANAPKARASNPSLFPSPRTC
jgi:hypothetical protein